jgi:hypothetical protein
MRLIRSSGRRARAVLVDLCDLADPGDCLCYDLLAGLDKGEMGDDMRWSMGYSPPHAR